MAASDTLVHGCGGFGDWRARADRFLAGCHAVERHPTFAAYMDGLRVFRSSLETAARLFADVRSTRPNAREDFDRSEGRGIIP